MTHKELKTLLHIQVQNPLTHLIKTHLLQLMCQHFSGQFSKYFLAVSSDFVILYFLSF